MEKFISKKRKMVEGRGHVFLVTLPLDGAPTDLLGKQVNIDGAVYRCTGMESRGVPQPGADVCLVSVPTNKRSPRSK